MRIKELLKTGLIAGAIAAIVNTLIFFISKAAGSVSDTIALPNGTPLKLFAVILACLIAGVVAALFLLGLSKISKKPIKIFTIVSIVALLISLGGPIGAPNIPIGTRITLLLMHFSYRWFTYLFFNRIKRISRDAINSP